MLFFWSKYDDHLHCYHENRAFQVYLKITGFHYSQLKRCDHNTNLYVSIYCPTAFLFGAMLASSWSQK